MDFPGKTRSGRAAVLTLPTCPAPGMATPTPACLSFVVFTPATAERTRSAGAGAEAATDAYETTVVMQVVAHVLLVVRWPISTGSVLPQNSADQVLQGQRSQPLTERAAN